MSQTDSYFNKFKQYVKRKNNVCDISSDKEVVSNRFELKNGYETKINLPNVKEEKSFDKNHKSEQKFMTKIRFLKILFCDISSLFAALGLILMVLQNEFIINKIYDKGSVESYIIKSLISLSTFFLLMSVICFHLVEYLLEDWAVELTGKKIRIILIQLILFGIHPIPGNFRFMWSILPITESEVVTVDYDVDIILSVLMFPRFYLFLQSFLLHMSIFNGKFEIIGRMNAIKFNFYFKIKTLTTFHPGRVLIVFNSIFLIIASYYLRLTERQFNNSFDDFTNSMWCIMVTFLTIGYGDLTPVTFLGRTIVILSGLLGIASSSLIIAVLARQINLSKSEQLVHSYIKDEELNTKFSHSAAFVIQKAWKVYKLSKNTSGKNEFKHFIARRNLSNKINKFQYLGRERKRRIIGYEFSIEQKQKCLYEFQLSLMETINSIKKNQDIYLSKMINLEKTMSKLRSRNDDSKSKYDICQKL